jgi:hypothetical protein
MSALDPREWTEAGGFLVRFFGGFCLVANGV